MEQNVVKYCNVMYGALRPAFSTAAGFAKKNGTPYSVLLTTTPSDLDSENGLFTYKLINDAWRWDEKAYDMFFDNDEEFIHGFVEDNSNNNFVYIEYSYSELGKDEKWFRKQIKELGNDMALVKREILLEWTYASVDSVFEEEDLDRISKYVEKSEKNGFKTLMLNQNKYLMYIIEDYQDLYLKNWLVSIDISGGLGQDRTVITVIDPADERVKMLLISNSMPLTDLEEVLIELKTFYLPKAIFAPELNYSGEYLIGRLQKLEIFKDSFVYTKYDRNVKAERTTPIMQNQTTIHSNSKFKKPVKQYGVRTTKSTRGIMINEILFDLVHEKPELFNNKFIFSELKTLVKKKNGKIEHREGAHDDVIFSYLIGLYALRYMTESTKVLIKRSNPANFKSSYISENSEIKKEDETTKKLSTIDNLRLLDDRNMTGLNKEMLLRSVEINDQSNENKLSNRRVGRFSDLFK